MALESELASALFGPLYTGKKIVQASDQSRALSLLLYNSIWNCLDLLERLLELGKDKSLEEAVKLILVAGSSTNPECFLLGFSKVSFFITFLYFYIYKITTHLISYLGIICHIKIY